MERFLTKVVVAGAALTILCSPALAAAVENKDVRVINTTAEPVPVAVQGTATVSGAVQITNTPTVGLDPSQNTVAVAGTATIAPAAGAVFSVRPANEPVLLVVRNDFDEGGFNALHHQIVTGSIDPDPYVVPADSFLVLTDFWWHVGSPNFNRGQSTIGMRFYSAVDTSGGGFQLLTSRARFDDGFEAFTHEALTTGIEFGAGRLVVAQLESSIGFQVGEVRAAGYLVPAH